MNMFAREFRWGGLVLSCTVGLALLARSGDSALGAGKLLRQAAQTNVAYVGSKLCGSCHNGTDPMTPTDVYTPFMKHGHAWMTVHLGGVSDPTTVPAYNQLLGLHLDEANPSAKNTVSSLIASGLIPGLPEITKVTLPGATTATTLPTPVQLLWKDVEDLWASFGNGIDTAAGSIRRPRPGQPTGFEYYC